MFHALPPEEREHWQNDLLVRPKPFSIQIDEPFSIGRGVALKISSPELIQLHAKLQSNWQRFLSKQDQQKYRPHCTIQNKVTPEVSRETLEEVRREWKPIQAQALGLSLWKYLGGPWSPEETLDF